MLLIGAKAGSEEKLCPENDFKLMWNKVKTLDVWLSINPEITMKAKYDEKLTKLKASLDCWELQIKPSRKNKSLKEKKKLNCLKTHVYLETIVLSMKINTLF